MYSLTWAFSLLVGLGLSVSTFIMAIISSMVFRGIILRYSE